MKIYTGKGDRGKTSLFSGEKVDKSHERIEVYGDVDELNSVLGAVAAFLPSQERSLDGEIRDIQRELIRMSAWLATTPTSPSTAYLQPLTDEPRQTLEAAIDRMEEQLEPLRHFILPGGHPSAAMAHVARTVCRRAERRLAGMLRNAGDPPGSSDAPLQQALVFLNRLSDYLFVLARTCNRIHGKPESA